MNNINNKQDEYKNICCPNCKSNSIIKKGFRKTENRGLIQRFSCKECSHRFVIDNGFYRMRNNPRKVTLCLDLFYKGVSTRQVQEHLQAFYPHNSSHMSIYRWVVKFSKIISKLTDSLKLNVSEEVQIDEVEYKRRLYHQKGKKGTEDNFFIDSIDPYTKFMVASDYVKSRNHKEIKGVMENIKYKTGKQIKIVTTDGLQTYENVIRKVYGYNHTGRTTNVFHNKVVTSKEEVFNYPIERLHNNIRARTKIFRGFHGSLESANAIMKGYEIFYNFIRKNLAINCCPYELATDLKLNNPNRWVQLINLATQKI